MSLNLFELSAQEQEFYEAFTRVNDEGKPLTEEEQSQLIEAYMAADEQFKGKVERYCELIEGFGARAEFRAKQAKRITTLSKQDQTVADKLTRRLLAIMEQRGERRIDTNLYSPHIVGNGGQAPVEVPEEWLADPSKAPKKYQKVKVELDVSAIRDDLKANKEVQGCSFGKRGSRLVLH